MSLQSLIEETESLPVEKRALLADSLLRSLNPPRPEIDRLWVEVVQRRLADVREGKVRMVPAREAFERIAASLKK